MAQTDTRQGALLLADGPSEATPAQALRKPAAPAPTGHLPSLTGLRFIAALTVFISHVGMPFPDIRLLADDNAAEVLFRYTRNMGGPTIVFFFVLSGFIMTWTARPGDTAGRFWRRRALKIFPNYALTWGLAMILYAAAYTSAGLATSNLLMAHSFVPKIEWFSSVDQPSWSMGCEALFYLSFPVLLPLLRRIRPARLKYWITGLVALDVAVPAFAYALLPNSPFIPGGAQMGAPVSETQYWFAYFAPPLRITEFLLGVLLALALRHNRWRNIGLVWSGLAVVVSYILCWQVPFLYAERGVITILPFLCLIGAATQADLAGRFTLFRSRTLVWLGEISFAFYLLHYIVLTYGRKVLGQAYFTPTATAFLVAGMFALTILLAWAMYALVERPVMRRWANPKRRTTVS